MKLYGRRFSVQPWEDYIDNIVVDWGASNIKDLMSKMVLGASTYAIWRERNNISFSGHALSKEIIFTRVYCSCRDKRAYFSEFSLTMENERIAKAWAFLIAFSSLKRRDEGRVLLVD